MVTGVRENEFGDWDWLTVKYHDKAPVAPALKTPRWDISFPQNPNNSDGDDYPVGITVTSRNQWAFPVGSWLFWIAGVSVDQSTGEDYLTVYYVETGP